MPRKRTLRTRVRAPQPNFASRLCIASFAILLAAPAHGDSLSRILSFKPFARKSCRPAPGGCHAKPLACQTRCTRCSHIHRPRRCWRTRRGAAAAILHGPHFGPDAIESGRSRDQKRPCAEFDDVRTIWGQRTDLSEELPEQAPGHPRSVLGRGGTVCSVSARHGSARGAAGPMTYQMLKSVGHSTMAVGEVAAPYVDNPGNQSWRAPMLAYRSRMQSAMDGLDQTPLPPEWRDNSRTIL